MINNVPEREAIRLRSDIYWSARQWQKSAEQTELLLADRWRGFEPLSDIDRSDILRAGIAYALADDKIGHARLREKFTAKMAQTPDRRAFEVVSGGISVNSPEFRDVARMIASIDTLEGFLRDLRALSGDQCALRRRGAVGLRGAKEARDEVERPVGQQARRFADRLDPPAHRSAANDGALRISWVPRRRAAPANCRSSGPASPRPGSSRRPARRRSA